MSYYNRDVHKYSQENMAKTWGFLCVRNKRGQCKNRVKELEGNFRSSAIRNRAGLCSGNALDLYSGGVGSNLGRDTSYPEVFRGFSIPPGKCLDSTSIRLQQLPSESFHLPFYNLTLCIYSLRHWQRFLVTGFLLGLLMHPEDGVNNFLRKSVNFDRTTRRHIPKDNILYHWFNCHINIKCMILLNIPVNTPG
jgi:hypothetical protein